MKVKKMGVFLCKNLDPWGQFHLTSGTLWYWLHDVTFYFQTNFLQHEVSSISHRREPPNYSPRNILLGEIFLPITIALDYFLLLLQVFRLIKYVASALAPCCRKKIECNADFLAARHFPPQSVVFLLLLGPIFFNSSFGIHKKERVMSGVFHTIQITQIVTATNQGFYFLFSVLVE